MPLRAKRECEHGGCRTLTSDRYCEVHKRKKKALNQDCGWRRGERANLSPRKRGYDEAWARASRVFLAEHKFCNSCKIRAASVTDHIIPHKGDMELFWDEANWQPLCFSCHAKKSARERHIYED